VGRPRHGWREEFARVDRSTYVAGRSAVLRSFLERPSIYLTHRGRLLWESKARRNLERSVNRLSSGGAAMADLQP
jgi:predicted metal-dependent HD superfamily phosphohydrolase